MDKIEKITFYMNSKKEFIYLDKHKNILNGYSRFSINNKNTILNELNNCINIETIENKVLHYYERPSAGIAHCVAKISTYLRLTKKYRSKVIIPNNTNENVINLTKNIFDNIILLQPNIKYIFSKFIFSAYFELMDDPKIMKPDNKYPLIVYNNDIYWFRTFINKYVDISMEKKPVYDKIFVGKFEGQGSNNSNITKPRSILGCVSKKMLKKFEKNGFKNIDPYKYHIQDVIYYLRNAKEIILSCGTCAHLYLPYLKSDCKLYYMINVQSEMGITYGNLNIDYNIKSDIVQRFFPLNTKVCFYKYAPHYDARVNKDNYYNGTDMFNFFSK
jgi:hypothetical protein